MDPGKRFAKSLYSPGSTPPSQLSLQPRGFRKPEAANTSSQSRPQQQSQSPQTRSADERDRYPSPRAPTAQTGTSTPTGSWQHPAVAEIAHLHRRRGADDGTVRRVLYNAAALWLVWRVAPMLRSLAARLFSTASANTSTSNAAGSAGDEADDRRVPLWFNASIHLIVLLLAYNLIEALSRFVRVGAGGGTAQVLGEDAEVAMSKEGVALTPRQRALLNLPESASPKQLATTPRSPRPDGRAIATPGRTVTPPRYVRNVTPSPASTTHSIGDTSAGAMGVDDSPLGRRSAQSPLSLGARPRNSSDYGRSPSGSHGINVATSTNTGTVDLGGSARWRYSQLS